MKMLSFQGFVKMKKLNVNKTLLFSSLFSVYFVNGASADSLKDLSLNYVENKLKQEQSVSANQSNTGNTSATSQVGAVKNTQNNQPSVAPVVNNKVSQKTEQPIPSVEKAKKDLAEIELFNTHSRKSSLEVSEKLQELSKQRELEMTPEQKEQAQKAQDPKVEERAFQDLMSGRNPNASPADAELARRMKAYSDELYQKTKPRDLSNEETNSCGALFCLIAKAMGGGGGGDCKAYLKRYFKIKPHKRHKFLNICPSENDSSNEQYLNSSEINVMSGDPMTEHTNRIQRHFYRHIRANIDTAGIGCEASDLNNVEGDPHYEYENGGRILGWEREIRKEYAGESENGNIYYKDVPYARVHTKPGSACVAMSKVFRANILPKYKPELCNGNPWIREEYFRAGFVPSTKRGEGPTPVIKTCWVDSTAEIEQVEKEIDLESKQLQQTAVKRIPIGEKDGVTQYRIESKNPGVLTAEILNLSFNEGFKVNPQEFALDMPDNLTDEEAKEYIAKRHPTEAQAKLDALKVKHRVTDEDVAQLYKESNEWHRQRALEELKRSSKK